MGEIGQQSRMGHMGLSIGRYVDDTLIYIAAGRIVRNAERCISYSRSVVCPSVRHVRCFVQRNEDITIMRSSVPGGTMTLVSGEEKFTRTFVGITPSEGVKVTYPCR